METDGLSLEHIPAGAVRVPLKVDQIPVNFTDDEFLRNVRNALGKPFPVVGGFSPPNGERLLICGNGPSLEKDIPRLRKLGRKGVKIVGCNNAYAFLKKHRVPVWAQAVMDASENSAKYIEHGDDIQYLVGLTVHPSLLDRLEGKRVLLFGVSHHNEDTETRAKHIASELCRQVFFIGGGSTITLRMPWLGYLMGFRRFEIYGVDSSFSGSRQYALPAHAYRTIVKVFCGDKEFLTSPQMADQAASFQGVIKNFPRLFPDATIGVYGEGLIPEIMRQARKQEVRNGS